jgi:hypothetical protein
MPEIEFARPPLEGVMPIKNFPVSFGKPGKFNNWLLLQSLKTTIFNLTLPGLLTLSFSAGQSLSALANSTYGQSYGHSNSESKSEGGTSTGNQSDSCFPGYCDDSAARHRQSQASLPPDANICSPSFMPDQENIRTKTLSKEALLKIIKANSSVPLEQAPVIQIEGNCVFLSLYRHTCASLQDLKIDAVLLTKSLLDKFPDQIDETQVAFFYQSQQNHYTLLTIRSRNLKAFAAGALNQADFLRTIEAKEHFTKELARLNARYYGLSYLAILETAQNPQGPLPFERGELLRKIKDLKKQGHNTSQAFIDYLKVEDKIRNRDNEGALLALEKAKITLTQAEMSSTSLRIAGKRNQWQKSN